MPRASLNVVPPRTLRPGPYQAVVWAVVGLHLAAAWSALQLPIAPAAQRGDDAMKLAWVTVVTAPAAPVPPATAAALPRPKPPVPTRPMRPMRPMRPSRLPPQVSPVTPPLEAARPLAATPSPSPSAWTAPPPDAVADAPAAVPSHTLRPAAAPEPAAPVQAPASLAPPAAAPPPATVAISAVEYLTPPVLNYPLAARRLREQGRVDVRVLVDARGLPQQDSVTRSSGHVRLDESALATVRATRFKPYTVNGVARAFWVLIPLVFELEN